MIPTSEAVGFLVNPNNPNTRTDTKNVQAAALALGLRLHVQNASGEHDFGPAFESLIQRRVSGIFVNVDPVFTIGRNKLVELAARHAMPAIYYDREFADGGGLMSYGASLTNTMQQRASILAGFSRARSPPIYQYCSRPNSNSSSTSKRLRHLASTCPIDCSRSPTR